MAEFEQDILNIRETPEAQALLKRHMAEQFQAGIYKSYLSAAGEQFKGPYADLAQSLEFAGAELPIGIIVVKNYYSDVPDADCIFLDKFDPKTGRTVVSDTGMDAMVFVAITDRHDGAVHERSEDFTDEQIELIHQQAQELDANGLLAQL